MTQPRPAASPAAPPPPGRYRIDPARTTVRVDVQAMFGLMKVHGTFRLRDGEVQIAADPGQSSVRLTIDAGSFTSGLSVRDADVLSPALLDAADYPDIVFAGRGPRPDGSGWLLPGTLTAHGVTDPVEIRLAVSAVEDGVVRFHAAATLDRARFGITKKKGMVGRTIDLTVEADCRPA